MKKSERKQLRLKNYDYSEPGVYFLTICTKNRTEILCHIPKSNKECCFLKKSDIHLTEMGIIIDKHIKSADKANVSIDNYVIMPNHIHLMVRIVGDGALDVPCNPEITANFPEINKKNGTSRTPSPTNAVIPQFVSTLKRFINKEIGESIFQRSYHDHIIRNEKEYEKIWEYIEHNPATWKDDCLYFP